MRKSSLHSFINYSKIQAAIFVVFILLITASHAQSPKHPPTFDDFMKIDDADLDQALALSKAMNFTPSELELIKKRGIIDEIIGAGVQASTETLDGLELLNIAIDIEPSNKVARAAYAYHSLMILNLDLNNNIYLNRIMNNLNELESIDPDNALPLYLRSLVYFGLGNDNNAFEELIRAEEKKKLITYETIIRQHIIKAALSLGYSEYTAKAYSMGLFGGRVYFKYISILYEKTISQDAARAFLLLGKRLESQSKLIVEHLIAYAIQKKSIDIFAKGDFKSELNVLEQKKKRLKKVSEFTKSKPITYIPEDRWIKFFDDAYTIGELKAYEVLIAEYGK